MSGGHARDRSRSMQASSKKNSAEIRPPRVVAGGVYSTDDLVNNLGVSKNTLTAWVRDGLASYSRGSRTQFFLADDLIQYWKRSNVEK